MTIESVPILLSHEPAETHLLPYFGHGGILVPDVSSSRLICYSLLISEEWIDDFDPIRSWENPLAIGRGYEYPMSVSTQGSAYCLEILRKPSSAAGAEIKQIGFLKENIDYREIANSHLTHTVSTFPVRKHWFSQTSMVK